jgi:hypothetical protein
MTDLDERYDHLCAEIDRTKDTLEELRAERQEVVQAIVARDYQISVGTIVMPPRPLGRAPKRIACIVRDVREFIGEAITEVLISPRLSHEAEWSNRRFIMTPDKLTVVAADEAEWLRSLPSEQQS